MEFSFAPMEGITYAKYRSVHAQMFPGAAYYYAPFIAPDSAGRFKAGNLRDVLPENNAGVRLIPGCPDTLLGIERSCGGERVLALFNFSEWAQAALPGDHGEYTNLWTGDRVFADGLNIPASGFLWLKG